MRNHPMYSEPEDEFEYIVLACASSIELSAQVTAALKEGFSCVGGHQTATCGNGVIFSQTIWRGPDEVEE